jgi:hypothetical protein
VEARGWDINWTCEKEEMDGERERELKHKAAGSK